MKILLNKVYGVDKCEVIDSAKLSEVAKSAKVVEGQFGTQVCMTLIQGGTLYATAKGDLKDAAADTEVAVATATIELVRNAETGHESYRVR